MYMNHRNERGRGRGVREVQRGAHKWSEAVSSLEKKCYFNP